MSVTDEAPSGDGAPTPSGAPAKRRHTARNAAIAVGVVMVALIALLATRGTNEPISSKIVGQAAPGFSGETTDGSTFTLANHRGEWVLVNFFATWCVPCRLEHPELVKFANEHSGDPETYIVAPSGLVVGRLEGVTADELDQIIDAAGGMAAANGA